MVLVAIGIHFVFAFMAEDNPKIEKVRSNDSDNWMKVQRTGIN